MKEPTYIARCKHGKILLAIVHDQHFNRQDSRDLAKAMERGLIVEHVEAQVVRREGVWGCDKCRKRPRTKPKKPLDTDAQGILL